MFVNKRIYKKIYNIYIYIYTCKIYLKISASLARIANEVIFIFLFYFRVTELITTLLLNMREQRHKNMDCAICV